MLGKVLLFGVAAAVSAHVGHLIRADVVQMQGAESHLIAAAGLPNEGASLAGMSGALQQLRSLQTQNAKEQQALSESMR